MGCKSGGNAAVGSHANTGDRSGCGVAVSNGINDGDSNVIEKNNLNISLCFLNFLTIYEGNFALYLNN